MSLSKPTLQQLDARSFPGGAPAKAFKREALPNELVQNVDEYQELRSKKIQDLVLNVTRLAWQECSGFPSSQSRAALLETLDDFKLAVESTTDTVLRLIYQV